MLAIASISGGGSQVGVGQKATVGSTIVSGNGQLTSSGIKSTSEIIQISENGFLEVTGSKQSFGDSFISGNGSIVAEGYQPEAYSGVGIISGNGLVSSVGEKNAAGTMSIHIEAEVPSIIMGSDGKLLKKISDTFYIKL